MIIRIHPIKPLQFYSWWLVFLFLFLWVLLGKFSPCNCSKKTTKSTIKWQNCPLFSLAWSWSCVTKLHLFSSLLKSDIKSFPPCNRRITLSTPQILSISLFYSRYTSCHSTLNGARPSITSFFSKYVTTSAITSSQGYAILALILSASLMSPLHAERLKLSNLCTDTYLLLLRVAFVLIFIGWQLPSKTIKSVQHKCSQSSTKAVTRCYWHVWTPCCIHSGWPNSCCKPDIVQSSTLWHAADQKFRIKCSECC